MKSIVIVLIAMCLIGCTVQSQTEVTKLLDDPQTEAQILKTIVGSHEHMMKLIDEIRKSDHAEMMINHILTGEMGSMEQQQPPDSLNAKSPYAGQQSRKIKSLSEEDIQKYLNGEGMGLAKVAELNHYPGPKHVMELSSQLKMSDEQTTSIRKIYDAMHAKAVRLGNKIVKEEEQLNNLFAQGQIDTHTLATSMRELGALQGEFRASHLQAHLEMRTVLSAAQIGQYDQLRGYNNPNMDHTHHEH